MQLLKEITAGRKKLKEGKLIAGKFCDFEGKNREIHKGHLPSWRKFAILQDGKFPLCICPDFREMNLPWPERDILFLLSAYLTVIISAKFRLIPFICAINIAATASYKAVPSILMVAPTGSTKRTTLGSMLFFSSKHRVVIGSVAEL